MKNSKASRQSKQNKLLELSLSAITIIKPTIQYEQQIVRGYCFEEQVFKEQCMYAFRRHNYVKYNIDTNSLQDYPHEQGSTETEMFAFCQFQNQIYSIEVNEVDKIMKLYCLNEKDCYFETIYE